jgi:hypothetical protein
LSSVIIHDAVYDAVPSETLGLRNVILGLRS